jgi:hypothetical protein
MFPKMLKAFLLSYFILHLCHSHSFSYLLCFQDSSIHKDKTERVPTESTRPPIGQILWLLSQEQYSEHTEGLPSKEPTHTAQDGHERA